LALLPHLLTGVRLLIAPLLWWLLVGFRFDAALACLAVAIVSDAVDGPLVRRFGIPSRAGAYFDVAADFAVIAAAFAAFARIGVYPAWLVGLIALVFLLFIVSSWLVGEIYDPIGRYIGGFLFAAVAATLLLRDALLHALILWLTVGALTITFGARAVFTLRHVRRVRRRSTGQEQA
jgi:phosphatidylglycerophosphate synthase